MSKVIVIGTIHEIGGACTSDELMKTVQNVAPNVVFCEASPEKFSDMLKATETFNTPEIVVLREIIDKQSMDVIPVDLDDDPFDSRLESMHELFRNRISEHYYASEIHFNEAFRLGFPYLNGEDSDQIFKDKSIMERSFVAKTNHLQLSETYRDWLLWNDKRENHWINVIQDYIERNKIVTAVFLVGSAHRIRLMEKVTAVNANGVVLEWDFFPFK